MDLSPQKRISATRSSTVIQKRDSCELRMRRRASGAYHPNRKSRLQLPRSSVLDKLRKPAESHLIELGAQVTPSLNDSFVRRVLAPANASWTSAPVSVTSEASASIFPGQGAPKNPRHCPGASRGSPRSTSGRRSNSSLARAMLNAGRNFSVTPVDFALPAAQFSM